MYQELLVLPRIPDWMDQWRAIRLGDPKAHNPWSGEKDIDSCP
jgi:hypothetical protein